ncbi:MAG TPA: hypothetical protein VFA63_12200 [Pseudonocardiaceae bacterium]|nr:hypothetical protein [Pseudonocardiaceae bacterium]
MNQLANLIGLVLLAGETEPLNHKAKLLGQRTGLASVTRHVGLVILNGSELQARLIAQRLTDLMLADCNSGHGREHRGGCRHGPHSPHVRPELQCRLVK